MCYRCGIVHGGICRHATHVDANLENVPWAESTKGKEWKALGYTRLVPDTSIARLKAKQTTHQKSGDRQEQSRDHYGSDRRDNRDRERHRPSPSPTASRGRGDKSPPSGAKTTTDKRGDNYSLLSLLLPNTNTIDKLIPCLVYTQGAKPRRVPTHATLDTGAWGNNYVSMDLVRLLNVTPATDTDDTVVMGALIGDKGSKSIGEVCLSVALKWQSQSVTLLDLHFKVLDMTHNLIIGLEACREYELTRRLTSFFMPQWGLTKPHNKGQVEHIACLSNRNHTFNSKQYEPATSTRIEEWLLALIDKEFLLEAEDLEDGEVEELLPDSALDLSRTSPTLPTVQPNFPLKADLESLISEYSDIFSKKLSPLPADVKPMVIDVDNDEWNQAKNRTPPRLQTLAKQTEIRKQVGEMMAQGLIQPSQAASYSQVLLAPKPNGTWRFCIDYLRLNEALKRTMCWPIPNIQGMIQRIGSRKPKFFACTDFTKGFWQTEVDPKSRHLLAFITPFGLYEPIRVPMGVATAPSYFQQKMAHEVLGDLLYNVCEIYIDDILIFADTAEGLIYNVRLIFQRLREKRVLCNPDKCKMGVTEIEFLGHVFSHDGGLRMSEAKLRKVQEFPKPMKRKDMKAFLGLANYFRDHVPHHSEVAKPLHDMLEGYTKQNRMLPLKWTAEGEAAFAKLTNSIMKSPALFTIEPELGDVILETDASDYGIGAYLYQRLPTGLHRPIRFMSASLTKTECRWSTIEKEAYAIFRALREWDYLLRDIPFLIRTDHRNLLFLNDRSQKVVHWKLAVWPFNFKVEHVPGVENSVADVLSRNLTSYMPPEVKRKVVSQLANDNISAVKGGIHVRADDQGSTDRDIDAAPSMNGKCTPTHQSRHVDELCLLDDGTSQTVTLTQQNGGQTPSEKFNTAEWSDDHRAYTTSKSVTKSDHFLLTAKRSTYPDANEKLSNPNLAQDGFDKEVVKLTHDNEIRSTLLTLTKAERRALARDRHKIKSVRRRVRINPVPTIHYINTLAEEVMSPSAGTVMGSGVDTEVEHRSTTILEQEIPQSALEIIRRFHGPEWGHRGVDATIQAIRHAQITVWDDIRIHVQRFIKYCPACQKMNPLKPFIVSHPFTTAVGVPMDKVSMDTIGPMPSDNSGFKYILVIVDNFSRWVELYPTVTVDAEECADRLHEYVGRFGAPSVMHSDNGTQFVNNVLSAFRKAIGSQQARSQAYSHEENGLVERANKEVLRHLRVLVYHDNCISNWSRLLPVVMRIMNTMVHSKLGTTPAKLLYGCMIELNPNLYLPTAQLDLKNMPTDTRQPSYRDYLDSLIAAQYKLLQVAQRLQQEHHIRHLSTFIRNKGKATVFEDGCYVLVQYPDKGLGRRPPTKLHTLWKGPMRVVSHVGNRYILEDLVDGKHEQHFVTSLKEFFVDDPDPIVLQQIAAHDSQEYVVEAILQHRGDLRQASSLEFLVKWLGFDENQSTWEPYSNLTSNEILHNYLKDRRLLRLIPRRFRKPAQKK